MNDFIFFHIFVIVDILFHWLKFYLVFGVCSITLRADMTCWNLSSWFIKQGFMPISELVPMHVLSGILGKKMWNANGIFYFHKDHKCIFDMFQNYRGFPVWLKYVPGISFRTNNGPFKVRQDFNRDHLIIFIWLFINYNQYLIFVHLKCFN